MAVIAYTDAGFAWLREHLTAEVVAAYFAPLGAGRVERFEAPNVRGLNFVLFDALAGGASRSLRTDTQGKTLAVALLRMVIEYPEPTPPAPLPEGKGEKNPLSPLPSNDPRDAMRTVTPLPFREGGSGGLGSSERPHE